MFVFFFPSCIHTHARTQAGIKTRDLAAGTASYKAPEQWKKEATSTASDVYGFGGVALEVVTGNRSFACSVVLFVLLSCVR